MARRRRLRRSWEKKGAEAGEAIAADAVHIELAAAEAHWRAVDDVASEWPVVGRKRGQAALRGAGGGREADSEDALGRHQIHSNLLGPL